MGKAYKGGKRSQSGGRFVALREWMMRTEAWASLKPGPRALFVELARRYTGSNNGKIYLSRRDAATALNVGRDTVANYFADLIDRGFIVITRGHCLGPEGVGQSSTYRLTYESCEGAAATKDFMAWKNQNPRRKIQHSLAGKSDTPCRKNQLSPVQMSQNPAALPSETGSAVSDNPAIYTSKPYPQGKLACAADWRQNLSVGRGLCGKAAA